MAYRISYGDQLTAPTASWRDQDTLEMESFATEHEALRRARELIEEGEHHAVAVCDDCGQVLTGIRLQLRLGFTAD
jgi:hypothetical protein